MKLTKVCTLPCVKSGFVLLLTDCFATVQPDGQFIKVTSGDMTIHVHSTCLLCGNPVKIRIFNE